ncbi:MAG: hypothetical protein ABIP89_09495, partial [Polyangiaceae bacterium]
MRRLAPVMIGGGGSTETVGVVGAEVAVAVGAVGNFGFGFGVGFGFVVGAVVGMGATTAGIAGSSNPGSDFAGFQPVGWWQSPQVFGKCSCHASFAFSRASSVA